MVFENGRLNLQKTAAEKNEKYLKRTIKISSEIDRKNEKVIRTTHFAELGIGTNPVINEIIGYLLTDEKIGGTIHLALGMAYKKGGGRNNSILHWDMIKDLRNDGAVYIDGKLLEKKGKFSI